MEEDYVKKKITAMGRKFPATYDGLISSIKSLPPTGGDVHIGPNVSIQLPPPASKSLGVRVRNKP